MIEDLPQLGTPTTITVLNRDLGLLVLMVSTIAIVNCDIEDMVTCQRIYSCHCHAVCLGMM